jgi:competence protein ComEA
VVNPTGQRPSESPVRGAGRHVAVSASVRWRGSQVTPHHVTLTALFVAITVAVAAWWVLRSAADAEPVQLSTQRIQTESTVVGEPAPATGRSLTETADPETSADAIGTVVVDVTGKVRHRGIVELSAGSRVIDAIDAAGGARPHADLSTLNLARVLIDGEQIVVGLDIPLMNAPDATSSAGVGDATAPLNLNTATSEQLETLPGIGPVTAAAILQWRDEHGSFTSVDELMEVSGIGPATLADIEALVYV